MNNIDTKVLQYCREQLRLLSAHPHNTIRAARKDTFRAIQRFVLAYPEVNMKHAPYVLQAWVDGVYFYYTDAGTWDTSLADAMKFEKFLDAEVFMATSFEANAARDSILVVPLNELD